MHSSKYRTGAAVKAMAASQRDPTLARIAEAVLAGWPLGFAQGVYLYRRAALDDVRTLAAYRKQTRHGDRVYYARSLCLAVGRGPARMARHSACPVASRTVDVDMTVTPADMERLLVPYAGIGLTGVSVSTNTAKPSAGVHASVDWWCALLRTIKHTLPRVRIAACAPADIVAMGDRDGITLEATLSRLCGAGLGLLAGGGIGGDTADDLGGMRRALCEWIVVHRRAHDVGVDASAVFEHGRGHTPEQRVAHLLAVRDFQQETLVSGRPAFGRLVLVRRGVRPHRARGASWDDDLRNYAVARLMAHNIEHIGIDATLDADRAARAVAYGADDFGGYASASAVDALVRRLSDIGAVPTERDHADAPPKRHHHHHPQPPFEPDTAWPIAPS